MLFQSATDLATIIRERRVSSTEVVGAHLEHVARHNGSLNAIVQLFDKEARARAAEADRALERGELWGPLHGVPVTIKEQFWIKNTPSTVNSKMHKDFVAPEDAVIVGRIRIASGSPSVSGGDFGRRSINRTMS